MRIKITLFIALLFAVALNAQVTNTGTPLPDWEAEEVCWSNAGIDSSLTKYSLFVTGQNSNRPVLVKYLNAAGAEVTVTGGVLRKGYCVASATPITTAIQMQRKSTSADFSLNNAAGYLSYSIQNVGFLPATITDATSNISELHTGETFSCSAQYDEATKQFTYCPPVTVQTGGSTIHYSFRTN